MAKPLSSSPDVRAQFERAMRTTGAEKIQLRLYVAGLTPKSTLAIADLKRICQEHLPGRCDVEVIDIYQQPERAIEAQIIAVPTLVKHAPAPLQRLIGSLGETTKVLKSLGFSA